jgi:hypothetical protein
MTFLMTCSCSLFDRISAQYYGADVTFTAGTNTAAPFTSVTM